jgi:elongation factor Ts
MADISLDEIKRLKDLTGVGLTDAKKALVEAAGDFDKALAEMRKKGLTKAEKRGEREASQGLVHTYDHGGRIGVVVEVNCETDFVARTDDFKALVHDIAMHIAASNPQYVSLDDVPADVKETAKAEFTEKVKGEGKPEKMVPQIVDGMLKKHFAERCLLEQPFIKNPDETVGALVKNHIAKLGENIVVRRMARLELGVAEQD